MSNFVLMNGSHTRFQEIVRTYQQPLYWYVRRQVLVHEVAEDILQETFLKAYRHLWQLRSETSLRPWLFRIATNEVNRHFKKRRTTVPQEEIPEDGLASAVDMAEEGETEIRASEVISAAILEMSPLQRQVFCLKYYEEMDYEGISRITGASKNTLMVSYHQARKKIEKEIMK